MRDSRMFIKGSIQFITTRTAEGLPFLPKEFMKVLIRGILARGQAMYPVEVCHFIFMPNHYHLIVVCDPGYLDHFMCYVNGELAKCINRFRGLSNRNVWATRYAAQALITSEDVIEKIVYIYANPSDAGLVKTIDQYPGLSSWDSFTSRSYTQVCPWYGAASLTKLPYGTLSEEMPFLSEVPEHIHTFTLLPDAWMNSFSETKNISSETMREKIFRRLRDREELHERERRTLNQRVIGITALRNQSFFKHYVPKKYGRKSIAICHDKDLREAYEREYRAFREKCRDAWEHWKRGDYLAPYPPGALRPPMPIVANILPPLQLTI